jgi:hypothetical protein
MSSASVVAATGHAASTPSGGSPSTSSTLVVAAAGPVASTPWGPSSTFLSVDGGRSPTFSSRSPAPVPPRARRRCFLALMVGAPGSPAPTPPGGPPLTFLSVDGGRSRIFSSNWPYLWVHSLSQGGPGGLCRYLEVPPHISSKLRQGAGHASTRCHVSCSFRPHLPVEVGSGAVTCPSAPVLASLMR